MLEAGGLPVSTVPSARKGLLAHRCSALSRAPETLGQLPEQRTLNLSHSQGRFALASAGIPVPVALLEDQPTWALVRGSVD